MTNFAKGFGVSSGVVLGCAAGIVVLVILCCVSIVVLGVSGDVIDDTYNTVMATLTTNATAYRVDVQSTPTSTRVVQPTPTNTTVVQPTDTRVPGSVCECSGDYYNCDSFATQQHAQHCYDYCVSVGSGDVHLLDSDDDGRVCE